jgi:hypothetical protein
MPRRRRRVVARATAGIHRRPTRRGPAVRVSTTGPGESTPQAARPTSQPHHPATTACRHLCRTSRPLRSQASQRRSPSAACRLPSQVCRLPSRPCRLLSRACRLLSRACRLLSRACRLLSRACRLLSRACRLCDSPYRHPCHITGNDGVSSLGPDESTADVVDDWPRSHSIPTAGVSTANPCVSTARPHQSTSAACRRLSHTNRPPQHVDVPATPIDFCARRVVAWVARVVPLRPPATGCPPCPSQPADVLSSGSGESTAGAARWDSQAAGGPSPFQPPSGVSTAEPGVSTVQPYRPISPECCRLGRAS